MVEAEEERRRRSRTTFSLDLLGRRVVSALSEGVGCTTGDATTTSEMHGDRPGAAAALQTAEELQLRRVIANPRVEQSPLFLNIKLASHKSPVTKRGGVGSGVSGGQVPGTDGGSSTVPAKIKVGPSVEKSRTGLGSGRRRVLDETPFEKVAREEVTATTHAAAMEVILASSQAAGPFDICQPSKPSSSKNIEPPPFTLIRPPPCRSMNTRRRNKHEILLPGLVIVRDYLPMEMQKEIISTVRALGMGPGGFYTPSYRDGAELNLAMMCMGLHWEPRLGTYESARTEHDGAIPPCIPAELRRLADQALVDVGDIVEDQKLKPLPPAQFDICLANFYRPSSGRLGIHQDKSESRDSLRRGVPVVSLSIGDAADFHFSRSSPDWERSSKVRLEGGDLLVFGGASRMVFHGISTVHAGTGPSELRAAPVNLLPGRINLTFRES
jgi:alkylated DNA repair dioxygenase AlkB